MEYKDDENLEKDVVNEAETENVNKVAEVTSNETDMQKEPVKNNKIIVSFLVTFLIIGLIIALVVMTVIPIVSSKEKFFKVSQNAGAGIGNLIEDFGNSPFGKMLTVKPDEKIQATTDLELALATQDQELLNVIHGFKNLKLTLNQDVDLENYYMAADAKVLVNDEDFVTANLLEDGTHIALKVPGIMDKYLRAEKNNLHSVWHRLNISGPDKISFENENFEKIAFTKAEQREVVNTLKRVFTNVKKLYTNSDFTEGNETISYNNAEHALSYVDVKLTSKKINDSVIAALEQLQKETKTLDIAVEKLNVIGEVYAAMGYETEAWTREELLTDIEDMLDEIRDFEVTEEEGMLLRVYYSGWDLKPVGMAMFELPTDEVYDFRYADGVNKLIADVENGYYEYSDQVQEYVDVVTTEAKVDTHQFEIRYKNYTTGEVLADYTEKYTVVVDNSSKNRVVLNLKDSEGYIDYTLSGEVNGKTQVIGLNMHDFYAEGETNDFNLAVTLNRDANFAKKVLAPEEFMDLNNATDEEFNPTITDVKNKWTNFVTANDTKLNQVGTIVGAYMMMFSSYNPYSYVDEDHTGHDHSTVDSAQG